MKQYYMETVTTSYRDNMECTIYGHYANENEFPQDHGREIAQSILDNDKFIKKVRTRMYKRAEQPAFLDELLDTWGNTFCREGVPA